MTSACPICGGALYFTPCEVCRDGHLCCRVCKREFYRDGDELCELEIEILERAKEDEVEP